MPFQANPFSCVNKRTSSNRCRQMKHGPDDTSRSTESKEKRYSTGAVTAAVYRSKFISDFVKSRYTRLEFSQSRYT